ncbi:hypothetical protein F5Y08DRAFT_1386 [Xylaria arbuscula]|nr:hypothetical protein F5Y08DRAFT_1386 [Xylaria arbuscula]
MPRFIGPLNSLMIQGWSSGLRFETKGYNEYDDKGTLVHKHRNLLHHAHSTHISKVLVRQLATRSPRIIAECLSDIYSYASNYVHLCQRMEPMKFWHHAKRSWEWSEHFKDDAFWAFTHKLFLARMLYIQTVPEAYHTTTSPLADALDLFCDRFYARYGTGVTAGSIFRTDPSLAELEKVEKQIDLNRRTRDAYFRYSRADSEGDGTDRIKVTLMKEDIDPNRAKYYWWEEPTEPAEDIVGFYFDLGIQNPRHGHRDAYQEIEDALKQAEEEDERAAQLEKEATGLEDEMMGISVNTEVDDVGDIGMGSLEV